MISRLAEGFFMGGANELVGATAAREARPWGELFGADVRGRFLDDFFGLVNLLRITPGDLSLVVLEVVEY